MTGGQTPEELESLLEDAFILRDSQALTALFEERTVLTTDTGIEIVGRDKLVLLAEAFWFAVESYLKRPRRIVQNFDTALFLGLGVTSVARRDRDLHWRFAISSICVDAGAVRSIEATTKQEAP